MKPGHSEKEKYFALTEQKQKDGLIDVKFCVKTMSLEATEEEVYGELNRLHAASDLPDEDIIPLCAQKLTHS